MNKVAIYPFHENDRWTYAWVFRRDASGRPVLRSLRLKKYPRRIVIDLTKPED